MRFERRAFLTVTADSLEEAERAFDDVNGELVGDGVQVSVDDGQAINIDEEE